MTLAIHSGATSPAAGRRPFRTNAGDRTFFGILAAAALLAPLLLICFVAVLAYGAWPALKEFGLSFLTSSKWSVRDEQYGALGYLTGTLVSSLLALAIAAPLGIGVATFLNEILPAKLRAAFRFVIEILATIPSVVYGLWGVYVMAPLIQAYVAPVLVKTLGFLPFISAEAPAPKNMLCAVFMLALMILPMIVSVSLESMRMVPVSLREASLGLGATRWEMIRSAVWPAARSGMIGACLLALGRALGETMAVTMVIGNGRETPLSILQPADTVASAIANQFAEAPSELFTAALIEMALLLFVVTLVVNFLARWIVSRLSRQMGAL